MSPPARTSAKRYKSMLTILALAALATGYALYKDPNLAWQGAKGAGLLFWEVLPNLVAGFLLAGMVQVLLPRDLVAAYAGEDSGWTGLSIATLAGAMTPGGPFVQFPLVASLWKAGTGVGPITAYITAWSLMGFQRVLVWEAPFMGWRYVTARLLGSAAIPFITGIITTWIFRRLPEF